MKTKSFIALAAMTLTLTASLPAHSLDWGTLIKDIEDGSQHTQKAQEKAKERERESNSYLLKSSFPGDTSLIQSVIEDVEKSAKETRLQCSPVVQNMTIGLDSFQLQRAGSSGAISEQQRIIQSMINSYVNSSVLEENREMMYKNDSLYKMTSGRGNVGGDSLTPLENIWYNFWAAKVAVGSNSILFTAAANLSKVQIARREMASTSQIIQTYYPGSSLSCTNMGSGTLVSGIQRTTYENFKPISFENTSPPFSHYWSLKSIPSGRVHLTLQRDAQNSSKQHSMSVDFSKKGASWEPEIRSVNLGVGLSKDRGYIDGTDPESTVKVVDDTASAQHLNSYYKKRFLPYCTQLQKENPSLPCNIGTFFTDLTDRSYASRVFKEAGLE